MTERRPLLSIVSPAYKEQEVLPPFHAELIRTLETLKEEYDIEVIYVDDGSSDATPAVITGMAARDPRVRYVLLSRNFGHQAALTAGLEFARGDLRRGERHAACGRMGVSGGEEGALIDPFHGGAVTVPVTVALEYWGTRITW